MKHVVVGRVEYSRRVESCIRIEIDESLRVSRCSRAGLHKGRHVTVGGPIMIRQVSDRSMRDKKSSRRAFVEGEDWFENEWAVGTTCTRLGRVSGLMMIVYVANIVGTEHFRTGRYPLC